MRGDAQAAITSLEQVLRARAAGLDMDVVLLVGISRGADGLVAREPLRSIADLAGKRVAMEESATASVLLAALLEGSGVPVTAIQHVPPVGDIAGAWRDASIAALLCREPLLSHLEAQGGHRIADTSRLPPLVMEVLAVRRGLSAAQVAGVQAVVKSLLRGRQILRSNPVDSNYRLAGRLDMDPADVQSPLFAITSSVVGRNAGGNFDVRFDQIGNSILDGNPAAFAFPLPITATSSPSTNW